MRILLLAIVFFALLFVIGALVAAFSHPHSSSSHNVIVIKPRQQQQQHQQQNLRSSSNVGWVKIGTPNGMLMFYTSQLTRFEMENGYIVIGFVGELELGPGTYTFYNVSGCRIGGDMEIVRIGRDSITIRALKNIYVRDCSLVVLRLS